MSGLMMKQAGPCVDDYGNWGCIQGDYFILISHVLAISNNLIRRKIDGFHFKKREKI